MYFREIPVSLEVGEILSPPPRTTKTKTACSHARMNHSRLVQSVEARQSQEVVLAKGRRHISDEEGTEPTEDGSVKTDEQTPNLDDEAANAASMALDEVEVAPRTPEEGETVIYYISD